MQGIPHHLIDILEPKDSFNVMEFKKYAEEAMAGIYERGHIPIITGGTGFYIQALLYDISFDEETEDGYRKELETLGDERETIVCTRCLQNVIRNPPQQSMPITGNV